MHVSRCLTIRSNSFFEEINRIALPDYIPTEVDVLQLPDHGTICATTFTTNAINIQFLELGGCSYTPKKLIHLAEDITSILFVADLSSYDQPISEEPTTTRLMESLVLFDSIVNSRWFVRASVILFLNNVSRFKQKLDKSPMQSYFPDYHGGNDVTRAAKYILCRFNQVNRAHLNLFTYLTEATDPSIVPFVIAAIKEARLQDALRAMGKKEKKRKDKKADRSVYKTLRTSGLVPDPGYPV
jgi:guanine nucleotide-binding protein subunit alpha